MWRYWIIEFFYHAKFSCYCSKELSVFGLNNLLIKLKGVSPLKKNSESIFTFLICWSFSYEVSLKRMNIHQNRFFSFFYLLIFFIYSYLLYFKFLLLFCIMSKEIGRFYKHNWFKLYPPTLKKPVLSFSVSLTSSAGNSTGTSI